MGFPQAGLVLTELGQWLILEMCIIKICSKGFLSATNFAWIIHRNIYLFSHWMRSCLLSKATSLALCSFFLWLVQQWGRGWGNCGIPLGTASQWGALGLPHSSQAGHRLKWGSKGGIFVVCAHWNSNKHSESCTEKIRKHKSTRWERNALRIF